MSIPFDIRPRTPGVRARQPYGQYCPLAYTLDMVGDSWTLLIMRELLHGPRGYRELLAGLPGIGPTLLTRRLKSLERADLLEQEIDEKRSANEPYHLTFTGRALEPIIVAMADWGRQHLPLPTGEEVYAPAWTLLSMKARYQADRAAGMEHQLEFRVDGESFYAILGREELLTGYGPAPSADVIVKADIESFLLVFNGHMSLREAIRQQRLSIEGSLTALATGLNALDLTAPETYEAEQRVVEEIGG